MVYSRFRPSCLLVLALTSGSLTRADEPAFNAGLKTFQFSYTTESGETRERSGGLWYPTTQAAQRYDYRFQIGFVAQDALVADGKHPLILFSHGYLGSADQTIFLMEALARHGYIVAAVNHADSLKRGSGSRPERPDFADVQSWTHANFRDRRDDLHELLEDLLRQNRQPDGMLSGHIDEDAIGAAGHSLGGYTTLGLVGGWPEWQDDRIKAALLLSPYANPYIDHGDLAGIKVPVMLQGATFDFGVTPFLRPLYNKLECTRYLLVLKRETHFAWTNLISLDKTTQECIAGGTGRLITDYSIAFFDKHLRGMDRPALTTADPELHTFRHDAGE